MSNDTLKKVIELYFDQILTFGYLELPKFYQPSSYKERIDKSLVNLMQICPRLDTLVSVDSGLQNIPLTYFYWFFCWRNIRRWSGRKYLRARCCWFRITVIRWNVCTCAVTPWFCGATGLVKKVGPKSSTIGWKNPARRTNW